jgi:hypothetical protein
MPYRHGNGAGRNNRVIGCNKRRIPYPFAFLRIGHDLYQTAIRIIDDKRKKATAVLPLPSHDGFIDQKKRRAAWLSSLSFIRQIHLPVGVSMVIGKPEISITHYPEPGFCIKAECSFVFFPYIKPHTCLALLPGKVYIELKQLVPQFQTIIFLQQVEAFHFGDVPLGYMCQRLVAYDLGIAGGLVVIINDVEDILAVGQLLFQCSDGKLFV